MTIKNFVDEQCPKGLWLRKVEAGEKMVKAQIKYRLVFAILFFYQAAAFSCTSFQIQAEDGTLVLARSNEFGIDVKSQIVFEPSGKTFSSQSPNASAGMSWTSKYAFLGVNGLGLVESFAEGMNEKGLSVEGLFFQASKYERPSPDSFRNLSCNDFVSWLLSNFALVDDVKQNLNSVKVWGETIAAFNGPFPLHFAVHDALGKCIVIEFINGDKKVYDNPIGVMTNMPEFPWHVTNLRNFLNLNPFITQAKDFNGVTVAPTGTGGGWLGIPGDWSPPSRFVRIAYLINMTPAAKSRFEALNLARHILNTVDIPKGSVTAQLRLKDGTGSQEYTRWSVLYDLTHRIFYYYSYENMNLKSIDLNKLASDTQMKMIPITEDFSSVDKTDQMKNKSF